MIRNNNYLADILRFCEIKDLIWVMRFQSPYVYFIRLTAEDKYKFFEFYKALQEFTLSECQTV